MGRAAPLATPMLMRSAFADEVSSIVLISQTGLPYLPMMVMEHLKLIEKHADKLGVRLAQARIQEHGRHAIADRRAVERPDEFRRHRRAGSCRAVGQDRRHGQRSARAVRRAVDAVHAGDQPRQRKDPSRTSPSRTRSRVPAVKVSSQAICLQMAAAKEWGFENYAKLDAFTITRAHPEAAVSVMSKATEINSHYSVAPFYYYELATAGRAQRAQILRHARRSRHQRRHAHDQEIPRRQSEGDAARSMPRCRKPRTSSTRSRARRRKST